MKSRVRAAAALTLAALASLSLATTPQQAPTFRTGVDAVTIDLSVFVGNSAVAGLTTADFVLTDNGVKQDLTSLAVETMPIDLTLVLDASGSVRTQTERMRTDMRVIAHMIRPVDGFRLLTFSTLVSAPLGLGLSREPSALDFAEPGGGTSFYNAVVSALIAAQRTGTADRRQLIVAMSDARDTTSFLDANDVRAAASTSDGVLHLFVIRQVGGATTPSSGWLPYWGEADLNALRLAADQTGGQLYDNQTITDVPAKVDEVLNAFRTSYVLRYVATGVTPAGWHEVVVRVSKPGKFVVRAKKGYFGVVPR
jgi:VWFA-related protein